MEHRVWGWKHRVEVKKIVNTIRFFLEPPYSAQINWASKRTKELVQAFRRGRDNLETSVKRQIASGTVFQAQNHHVK